MLVIEGDLVTSLVACNGGGEAHHSGADDANVHGTILLGVGVGEFFGAADWHPSEFGAADNLGTVDEAPIASVVGPVSVIADHKIVVFGDSLSRELGGLVGVHHRIESAASTTRVEVVLLRPIAFLIYKRNYPFWIAGFGLVGCLIEFELDKLKIFLLVYVGLPFFFGEGKLIFSGWVRDGFVGFFNGFAVAEDLPVFDFDEVTGDTETAFDEVSIR